ncbi:MAG TPA: hypothetical protein VI260_31750 [Blastocatellia bacterium]
MQELLFDSFLQTEISELLKFGAFAGEVRLGEVRLYAVHTTKPA